MPEHPADERRSAIVDQSDDTRDPADDSGEIDDPTRMAADYPGAFDGGTGEALTTISAHEADDDRRHGGGNGRQSGGVDRTGSGPDPVLDPGPGPSGQ